jgi:hypothetical protein
VRHLRNDISQAAYVCVTAIKIGCPILTGFVAQIAFAKDSLSESIVLSGGDEQLDTDDIQDPKLESV